MSTPTLPLSLVVDVTVNVGSQAPATPTFNQGLIVGPSAVIPSTGGTNSRIRQYSSTNQMLQDGFQSNSPEVLAANLYFGQTPAPQILWVGRQDLTAIQTAVPHASNAGTGYVVGDIVTVIQSGAQGGVLQITGVGAGGSVTSLATVVGQQGTGYAEGTALSTTGGTGTGLEVDITAIGETPLQAVQACRLVNGSFWGFTVTNAAKADHEAIAAWAQAATPQCFYFFTTADSDVLSGASTSVFNTLKNASYTRAMGIYSTTQGGGAPNNAYAAAAVMGVAMGLNTGLAGSYFTMKFKELAGVTVEPLTQTQVGTIEAQNGNVYVSYGPYQWFEQGVVPNGNYFDRILNLDMLASDIQYSEADILTSLPAVPQTDSGQSLLINGVNGAADRAVARGYISPGTWTGQTVLKVVAGTPLPKGYLAQSQSYTTQSQSDRSARKAMPIYLCLIESGAAHSITVGVYPQQ